MKIIQFVEAIKVHQLTCNILDHQETNLMLNETKTKCASYYYIFMIFLFINFKLILLPLIYKEILTQKIQKSIFKFFGVFRVFNGRTNSLSYPIFDRNITINVIDIRTKFVMCIALNEIHMLN